jgi:ubiquinone/menaquinone biosynthesis C-methylase UbiE
MQATGYAATWKKEEDLDALNRRIHDGVPLGQLADRADGYRRTMFEVLYPMARPQAGNRVLEFGSGVGWIMESVLRAYPGVLVTGLDISENMVAQARARLKHPGADFVLYDGFTFPFSDGQFDRLYSCAAIQHIEKHIAFLLFREMHRVLSPGGHAVLHVLSIHGLPQSPIPYETECWNHINNVPVHWHHYYAFDELLVLFSQLIGVEDLDIRHYPDLGSFFVHFSKGSGRKYLAADLPQRGYLRNEAVTLPLSMRKLRRTVSHSRFAPALRPVYRAGRRVSAFVRSLLSGDGYGHPAG